MSDLEKLSTEVITNRVTGTVTHPETGEDYEAVFKDLGEEERDELAELEEKSQEGDEEAAQELQEKVVNDYLIEPELKAEDLGMAWKQTIMVGFLRSLGDNKAIQSAQEFFDDVAPEGNP